MSLHWYTCISINILLEMVWWALFNASLIVWICSAIYEILANGDFSVTDDLISQLFVVTFVHPIYVQTAFIWSFPAQLGLWKSVHWMWKYKLNEVCDMFLKPFWEFQISIQITDISELEDAFIIWDRHANMTYLKRGELERATVTWAGVIGKEVLEF